MSEEYSDSMLVRLYSLWSEETWRASFMSPMDDVVKDFVEWLTTEVEVTEDYEREMLTKVRAILAEAKP